MYYACLCIYAAGVALRIALDRHWHSVNPHASDPATHHTYALGGHGDTVFLTPFQGYCLEGLYIVPWLFLVAGMLVWASTWREWK
jgi:hypothetical protein